MLHEILKLGWHTLTIAAWCYMASQGNKDGDSILSFTIEAITEVKDLGR